MTNTIALAHDMFDSPISPIEDILEDARNGRPYILVDAEDRENEGDIIIPAQFATPDQINFMIRQARGLVCLALTAERAQQLRLPPMAADNRESMKTAFTVSIEAKDGVTTGISAADRSRTIHVATDATKGMDDIVSPGHIFPLVARDGGVLVRAGHTEAAVDLARMAGLAPSGALCELVNDDGTMMRLPEILELGERTGYPVVTIADLIVHLGGPVSEGTARVTPAVSLRAETTLPTTHGTFRVRAYREAATGDDHVAIIADPIPANPLVRLHSECLTGEAFGSLKCECGPQLDAALDAIAAEGGVVIYFRGHEGRGIGLVDKLRAYRLQEDGLDTVDANTALGLPVDRRDFSSAAHILTDLGIDSVRLASNNPLKLQSLRDGGIEVTDLVASHVGVTTANAGYLGTKRDRMGHRLPDDAALQERITDRQTNAAAATEATEGAAE